MKRACSVVLLWVAALALGEPPRCGEWKLRESLTDKDKESNPASAFAVKPEGQSRSYGIDAALLYDFQLKSTTDSLFVFGSYDRNTELTDPQDLFTAGLGWEHQWDMGEKGWGPVLNTSLNYKRDGTLDAKGEQVTVSLTLDSELAAGAWLPGPPGPRKAGNWLSWQWEWVILGQLDRTETAANGGPEGSIYRLVDNTALYLYPGGEKAKGRIELLVNYYYTWDFRRSSELDVGDDRVDLFRSSLNLYFTPNRKYGVGFDYSNGAYPVEGLAEQSYYRLAFKAQI